MRNADTEIQTVFESPFGDMYVFKDNSTLRREEGETPNGNQINRFWVYRDSNGAWIDYDQYRHDIAARYNLNLSVIK